MIYFLLILIILITGATFFVLLGLLILFKELQKDSGIEAGKIKKQNEKRYRDIEKILRLCYKIDTKLHTNKK